MFSKANDVDKEGKNFFYLLELDIEGSLHNQICNISCSNQCLINFQASEKDVYISLASFDQSFVCGILRNGPFPQ